MKRLALVLLLVLAVLAVLAPRAAHAEEPRQKHFWFAAGSSTQLPEFAPGGWFGLGGGGKIWSLRADAFLFGTDPLAGLATLQVTRTLGRTGRHMVIELHFGGGVRFPDPAPLLAAGIGSRIGLQRKGPLYVALDGNFTLTLSELPFPIAFVSVLGIGLTW